MSSIKDTAAYNTILRIGKQRGIQVCTIETIDEVQWQETKLNDKGEAYKNMVWCVLWACGESFLFATMVMWHGIYYATDNFVTFMHDKVIPAWDSSGIDPKEAIRYMCEKHTDGGAMALVFQEVLNEHIYTKYHRGQQLEIEW